MQKSDPATRISRATASLLDLAPGADAVIARLPAAHRASLEQEGLVEGAAVRAERLVGLGGPLIVRLGRARLAVARSIASGVAVGPGPEHLETRESPSLGVPE